MSLPNRRLFVVVSSLMTGLLLLFSFNQARLAAQDTPDNVASFSAIRLQEQFHETTSMAVPALSEIPCVGGMADVYPCQNVDLLALLPIGDIGGGIGKDIWGWTDPLDDKEYVIMNRDNGTAFVDISDPINPVYLGNMPSIVGSSTWRDTKVYANHAYIVADGLVHGMQVYDLTELRNITNPGGTISHTFHYTGFQNAHNIVINEATGFAYAVGTNTCAGGLHIMDLQNPVNPTFVGCYAGDGYTHDAQCVIYQGPDADYQGREVCFNANEDTVTLVDVTDKQNMVQVARVGYPESSYVHQGWLTDDHQFFIQDDETDEINFGVPTRTRIWDMSDLDAPVLIGIYEAPTNSTDHNLYVHNGYTYQANNSAGLRVLDNRYAAEGILSQAAFFDVYPAHNNAGFVGSWSVYPYFPSGVVAVSSREFGLFLLEVNLPPQLDIYKGQPTGTPTVWSTLSYEIMITNTSTTTVSGVVVTDILNGVATSVPGPSTIAGQSSATYTFDYVVQPADCLSAGLSNLATVTTAESSFATTITPIDTPLDCYITFLPLILHE